MRCCNCGRKYAEWDQSCLTKLAANSKAEMNGTSDPGRYQQVAESHEDLQDEWQLVGSRKRRAATSVVEIISPVGATSTRRGPGRIRKAPDPSTPDISGTWAKLISSPGTLTSFTQNTPQTVTRESPKETNRAPDCVMDQQSVQIY